MSVNKKLIQVRYGAEADYDESKMLTGEPAVTTDTQRVFFGTGPGKAVELAKQKTLETEIGKLSEQIRDLEQNGTSGTATAEYIDYDLNVKAINHRGYSTEAPENTIPAYILSKKKGFKYVECDVSFTSDGVAVLLHDSTIDRTSDGTGSISEMTYEQVLQYDFGSWKSSDYTSVKIPTFEEFIRLCKNIGLHPYIELKTGTETQIQGVVDLVYKHGMKGKVTYISNQAAYLENVFDYDPDARLGLVVSTVTSQTPIYLTNLKKDDIFIDSADYDEEAVLICMEADVPLEIWTINDESIIKNMNPYITGVTSDNLIAGKVLYDASMNYNASDDNTEAILSSISATYTGGEVAVGTELSALTGIAVTGTYSDGSTSAINGYELSGTIAEGENTITVSYGGLITTFIVTGVVKSSDGKTLLHSYDFTNGFTDSVTGDTITNTSTNTFVDATQDSNGVTLSNDTEYVIINKHCIANNRIIELDIANITRSTATTGHGRLLTFKRTGGYDSGLIYRNTGKWALYTGSWVDSAITDTTYFDGKTVILKVDNAGILSVYVDDELIMQTTSGCNCSDDGYICIGSQSGNSLYATTIKVLRVYSYTD